MSSKINNYSEIIKEKIKNYSNTPTLKEEGIVISLGDGIVHASGLDNVMLNEIVIFENGSEGLVLNLEEDVVYIVMLGKFSDIKEKSIVKRTKKIISVPVGDELLGRVINSVGFAIDGKDDIKSKIYMPIERVAPGVMTRKSIDSPLETGILAIDAILPIGKGQRELIIGDRQTGKTTIAIDAIINQKGKNVYCVYVAIGQKNSTVANINRTLSINKSLEYTTIVSSTASDLPALNYLAPFTGIAIAEYWMNQGKDVLIVYDDLTKHAVAYRTLSLLLRRPPGREAYPGDIFYLHSRLLERACKLNEENGGGSITALPIIETQAGDISAYIPTNVISITDGQLFMLSSLFNSGQRPAIDPGLSVSRVGGSAQIPCIKKASSSLKLILANYNELESFSQFGADLDIQTKKILDYGKRIVEMIKQDENKPYDQIDETILLLLIKYEFINFIPIEEIKDFRENAINYFSKNELNIKKYLIKNKDYDDDFVNAFKYVAKTFIQEEIKTFDNYIYPETVKVEYLTKTDEEKEKYLKLKNSFKVNDAGK